MKFQCQESNLSGTLRIPGSKSHSIRAICIATMATGTSRIYNLLNSSDVEAALTTARAFGATVTALPDQSMEITGNGGKIQLTTEQIDVGNSGTTMLIALALSTLIPQDHHLVLTGDEQICRRPTAELVKALQQLGAKLEEQKQNGCPPIHVSGGLTGGNCQLAAPTSQYVTALLMACPLAPQTSKIHVTLLNEAPYVQITLDWLKEQQITVLHHDLLDYEIPGGQHYRPFTKSIPADFSTATFFIAAATLKPNRKIQLKGLDFSDSQPDKKVVDYLQQMGAAIQHEEDGSITISAPNGLQGTTIDMNETPDALPMMAVVGCFAQGETRLTNVAHARLKETDRISVMEQELKKMGADITSTPDGLIIRHSSLQGAEVCGHGDHRVVMSLTIAGLSSPGTTRIDTAEAVNVTVPEFPDFIRTLNGALHITD